MKGKRHEFIRGIDTLSLLRILWQNGFRVSPKYFGSLFNIGAISLVSSIFGLYEKLLFHRKIAMTKIVADPIFIIGHWRSGTSYLHKLLCLDDRHTSPTVFQCIFPTCFISAEGVLSPKLTATLPRHRPFDNVKMGVNEPFEEEFALMKMTLISPMLTAAFPRSQSRYESHCEFSTLSDREIEKWQKKLLWFLKKITFKTVKRIILKSPTHSFRIDRLLSDFPKAKFVCMLRDPYSVFASTNHLWKTLLWHNKLQNMKLVNLQQLILSRYLQLFCALKRGRESIPDGQYHEVRFEDLESDPIGTLHEIYDHLELGNFDSVWPKVEAYLREEGNYQKNVFHLTALERERVASQWEVAFREYGYPK